MLNLKNKISIALFILFIFQSFYSKAQSTTPNNYVEFYQSEAYTNNLTSIEKELQNIEIILNKIDLSKLSVDYQYGKLIEQNINISIDRLHLTQKTVNYLKHEFDISSVIIFLDQLDTFEGVLNNLDCALRHRDTYLDVNSANIGMNLSKEFLEKEKLLYTVKHNFLEATIKFVDVIDKNMNQIYNKQSMK